MVISAVMLVVLALIVIRCLMGVVAHEDAATVSLLHETEHAPVTPTGVWGDDVRSFLLPAAPEHIDLGQSEHDVDANAS